MLLPSEWQAIRAQIVAQCGDTCPHCGAAHVRVNVEWSYDRDTQVQTLTGMGAACGDCSMVLHFQAVSVGDVERVKAHLMRVNQWDMGKAEAAIAHAHTLYMERSAMEWTMDASWLWNHYTIGDASKARLLRKVRISDERSRIKTREQRAKDSYLRSLYGAVVPADAYTRTDAQNRVYAIRSKIVDAVAHGKGDVAATMTYLEQVGVTVPRDLRTGWLMREWKVSNQQVLRCATYKGIARALDVTTKDLKQWAKTKMAGSTI